MYKFNKFMFVVFGIITLCIALGMILVTLNISNFSSESVELFKIFVNYSKSYSNVYIICFGILGLLSLISLLTVKDNSENLKTGVAIKQEKGRVYISKDTIESIVTNVVMKYKEFKNVKTQIIINEKGAFANIFTYVMPGTELPNITSEVQENIKDAVLKQTTIKIEEVNIKVKGVYNQVEK